MLTGAHSQGNPPREKFTWDYPETSSPMSYIPPNRQYFSWETRMPYGSPLLHPIRPMVPRPLLPMGCSIPTSLSHRALSGVLAFNLHRVFLIALRSLGSEEQIDRWVPLCNNFQIITTYAQTELGHGEPGLLRAVHRPCAPQSQRPYSHGSSQTVYFI